MTSKLQALIVYGIDFEDVLPSVFAPNRDGLFDFNEFVCTTAGLVKPPHDSEEYLGYVAKREELLSECPARFCTYGDAASPGYILYVRGTEIVTEQSRCADFGSYMHVSQKRLDAFYVYCRAIGVTGAARWKMAIRQLS